MEYIQGYGWYWPDGKTVYQEQQLVEGLPIGHTDYGQSRGEIRVESHSNGYWVMDRDGSLHRHPFQSADKAQDYADNLLRSRSEVLRKWRRR